MTMAVHIDAADPTPPYEQLRRQLADAILSGQLEAGSRLPTVRQLAADLGLANGTVMRSYVELATGGLVETGRGKGTTVAEVSHLSPAIRQKRLAELATALVAEARLLGMTSQEVNQVVVEALAAAEPESETAT